MICNAEKLRDTPSDSLEAISFNAKQRDWKGSNGVMYCLELRTMTTGTKNKVVAKLYPKGAEITSGTFLELEYYLLDCPLMGENLLRYMDAESMSHYLLASQLFFPPCTRAPLDNGRILHIDNISYINKGIIRQHKTLFSDTVKMLLEEVHTQYVESVDEHLQSYPTYMAYLGYGQNAEADSESKERDAALRALFKAADFSVFECVDDAELERDALYLATFCTWALTDENYLARQKAVKEHDEPISEEQFSVILKRPFKNEGDCCHGDIYVGNIEWERARENL